MVVHRSSERPFGGVRHLGVIVRAVPPLDPSEPFGLHSGFLYRIDDGAPRFSHLAWHFDLQDEPAGDPKYLWSDTGLDEGNSRVVAAWLANRGRLPNDIPYGINSDGACFDTVTAQFVPAPVGKGLTCATYVKAVLSHLGFKLLAEDTWPTDRADDRSWQLAVVEALRARAAAAPHVDAVNKDVGSKRFRPVEVVGAATLPHSSWAVVFDDAAKVAQSIIVDVQKARRSSQAAAAPAAQAVPAPEALPLERQAPKGDGGS